ncbi:MAG TPA: aminomethyl-transferring glycine dehydrogenase subunit GcvPA [Desulfobacteria bacterium]|nr:aminomethyl-transferring glycine dehydrogenase subunit GcvPA [Desulfobacteria bacterium]
MRFAPNSDQECQAMLARIGANDLAELFKDIPENVRLSRPLALPHGISEQELVRHLQGLAARNANLGEYLSFLGAGAYEHYIPSLVNQLLLRSEFYTAYTPYQPEISQGTLTAIYEFQSMVCELTGMDVANASMYDGASALAEASRMACSLTRRHQVIVSRTVHPEYREVIRTYLAGCGVEILEIPYAAGITDLASLEGLVSGKTAAVLVQNPNFFGAVEDGTKLAELTHAAGALLVVAANPVSLGLLKPPGAYGADIVAGEGQPFGNPISYGGPFLGFLACREKYLRRLPGRIVGATTDSEGRRAFVLTLQAREQHIRREKATSNICSNEALCALAFTMHLSALGKQGISELANLNLQKSHYAAAEISRLPGFELAFATPFFNEFVIRTERKPAVIQAELQKDRILAGLDLARFFPELNNHLLICVTETKTKADIDRLVAGLEAIK